MSRIGVILGSTRPNRISPQIGQWAVRELRTGSAHVYVTIDLQDLNLPLFNEPQSPRVSQDYRHEYTKKWSALASSFDAFVLILPEYNGNMPAVLKNALDYLYQEWQGKFITYISYGFDGGTASAAAFEGTAAYFGFTLIDKNVSLCLMPEFFDENGQLVNPTEAFAAHVGELKAIDAAFTAALAAS